MSKHPTCETCEKLRTMQSTAQETFDMSKYTDAVVLLRRHQAADHPAPVNSPTSAGR